MRQGHICTTHRVCVFFYRLLLRRAFHNSSKLIRGGKTNERIIEFSSNYYLCLPYLEVVDSVLCYNLPGSALCSSSICDRRDAAT